ncbi:shikimate dehydrogenase [Rubricoccus marinus]|uniref:shikimate dehydrogenase n=1 Tax=Rubricoccus marinus TaxID=716817 RepID=UPI000B989498|nr:shikimate dehydrogenase [Rubricoccus marinus]
MTGLVVLLGAHVEHSLSPALHNSAFRAQNVGLVYAACSVSPEALTDAIRGLHALGAAGANVTIPHKQAVFAMAESVSPEAKAVGAANTLVRTESGWHAHNTDVAGFLAPLAGTDLSGAEITVLGAGGAARAVVYALLTAFAPSRLTIANRRVGQAEAVADVLSEYDARGVLQTVPLAEAPSAQLVVNCTPLGMVGMEDLTPIAAGAVGTGQIAYDLVYRPAQTRFMREAVAHGAEAIGGLPMLVGQAAESYKLWTGRDMPTDIARRAALDAL